MFGRPMKVAAILAAMFLAPAAQAQPKVSVSLHTTFSMTVTWLCSFERNGDALTGSCGVGAGDSYPAIGSVAGNMLKVDINRGSDHIVYAGNRTQDGYAGTVMAGSYEGSFTADVG